MADKSTRSKRYTEEFKLQAAKLIVEGGTTYHQASQQLGVSDWALAGPCCWVKAFRESGHLAAKGQAVPLAEELKAARRELAQLRLENEILKKSGGVLRQGVPVRYAWIETQRDCYPLGLLCRVLHVRGSGDTTPGACVSLRPAFNGGSRSGRPPSSLTAIRTEPTATGGCIGTSWRIRRSPAVARRFGG